jgi:hypothetical protein
MRRRSGFNKRLSQGDGLLFVGTRHRVPVIDDQGSQVRFYIYPPLADVERSKRRLCFSMGRVITTFGLVMALTLVVASAASAAVSLEFTEAKHEGTPNRGDELVSYSVKLKNTGSTATAGATNVSIALPGGAKLAAGEGAGWSCHMSAQTCSSSAAVAGGAEFARLKLEVWVFPE